MKKNKSFSNKRTASATYEPLRGSTQKGYRKKVSFFNQLLQSFNKKILCLLLLSMFVICYSFDITAGIDKNKIEKLKQELEKAPDFEKSRILNELAKQYFEDRENFEKIVEYGQKALESSRKFNNIEQEIYALANLGHGYWRMDKNKKGMEFVNMSIKLAEKNDKKYALLYALKFLAIINDYIPNDKESLRIYKRMKAINEDFGDKEGIAKCTHCIGSCYYALGEINKSYEHYKKALELYKEVGNKRKTAQMLAYLGYYSSRFGNDDKAMEYYIKAAEIGKKNGIDDIIGRVYHSMGGLYKKQKKYKSAFEYYKKSLEIFKKKNQIPWLRNIYLALGELCIIEQDYNKSLEYLNNSLKYHNQIRGAGKDGAASILIKIGRVNLAKKDYDKALENNNLALKIALKYNKKKIEAESKKGLGEVYMVKGDLKKALSYFKKSLEITKKMTNKTEARSIIKENYKFLVKLYTKLGKQKQADMYQKLYSNLDEKK